MISINMYGRGRIISTIKKRKDKCSLARRGRIMSINKKRDNYMYYPEEE
jgi:ribosomal protein L36